MPMVSESYSDKPGLLRVTRNSDSFDVTRPSRVVKSQTGFRSGALTHEQSAGLSNQGGTWATSRAQIESLDQAYEHTSRASRNFMVNDRDFTEVRLNPCTFAYTSKWVGLSYKGVGAIVPQSLAWDLPPAPTTAALESMAAEMLRQSMPTKVELNFTRFAGELPQGAHMLNVAAYAPRTLKELGGGVLNMLFGVMPTTSDLLTMAELVVSWDEVLQKYISQEKRSIRRRRSKVLYESTTTGRLPRYYNQNQLAIAGPATVRVSYLVPSFGAGASSDNLDPNAAWSCRSLMTLDTFGTWEYFIPRPEKIEGRMRRYKQFAQKIMGGGLDAPTMYDLTPWSWMADWLVDVGGLLRYQQDMVDNQVVASKLGYTLNERMIWTLHSTARTYVPGTGRVLISDVMDPCTASASRKRITRRKGNPYSIAPTWENLSSQQWAILAALGLSRGRGVPTASW